MRERKRRTPKRRGGKVIYFSAEERSILDAASKLDGRTASDVIRRAIRWYYRKLLRTEKIAS